MDEDAQSADGPSCRIQRRSVDIDESFTIYWTKDGVRLDAFANKTNIIVEDDDAVGSYVVDVKYTTEEVRVDSAGLLTAKVEHVVKDRCARV